MTTTFIKYLLTFTNYIIIYPFCCRSYSPCSCYFFCFFLSFQRPSIVDQYQASHPSSQDIIDKAVDKGLVKYGAAGHYGDNGSPQLTKDNGKVSLLSD